MPAACTARRNGFRVVVCSPLSRAGALALASLLSAACAGKPAAGAQQTPARGPTPTAQEPSRNILASGTKLYSQADEELIVRDFFQDRREGYFLDVGCASPIANSNTYYLESELGWSGIGVDALPEFARSWERKRPHSRFFNFFVSDHGDTLEPFYRSELKGTSSGRGLEHSRKGPGGKTVRVEELKVPTTTLDKLLDAHGVKHVDFLSMDIEGFEPLALAGLDIERFKVQLACIEAKPPVRERILAYFARRGYVQIERYLAYDKVNYYFTPKTP